MPNPAQILIFIPTQGQFFIAFRKRRRQGGNGKERWGKERETGSGRKLRVGYAKRKMGVVRFDQVKNLTFPVRGVQLVSRGPHGAQDGYEFGPTQNHKFT